MADEAIFFETPSELRAWLEEHHATASELWVGYYKKASGRRSLTWYEVVDEALCFGWIDGKAQGIDAKRPETQARRLATLIQCSSEEQRVPALAT